MAFEALRRWASSASRFELLSTVVGVAAGIVSAIAVVVYKPADIGEFRSLEAAREQQMLSRQLLEVRDSRHHAETQLDALRRELDATRSELAHIRAGANAKVGTEAASAKSVSLLDVAIQDVGARSQRLDSRLTDVDTRLKLIETAIVADPQKALTVPLLRRDLDSLQQQVVRDVTAINAENSRAYDLMKWLIGLMAIVSFSLIGTAVSGVFKREESASKSATDALSKRPL
ncbi:MAG: hypothetical protein WB973_16030 [Thermoanaerobaculia bacterium]